LISTVVMFQAQNRETIYSTKNSYVLHYHYDDRSNKIVFHNTTPDLQDQDQDRFFWSETGPVLRPTASGHFTAYFNAEWNLSYVKRIFNRRNNLSAGDCVSISLFGVCAYGCRMTS